MARFVVIGLAFVCVGCRFQVAATPPPEAHADLAMPFDLAAPADLARLSDLAQPPRDLTALPDLAAAVGFLEAGMPEAIPGTVNLSDEGTYDWVHCGYLGAPGIDDHKNGGPNAFTISAVGGSMAAYTPYTPTFTWSNGTPYTSNSTQSGAYNTGKGHGMSIKVPADTTTRTLRLYLTNYQSTVQLTASLSDKSAPAFSGTMLSSGLSNNYYRYTIVFHAAKSGQELDLQWLMTKDAGGGSVDVLAATLQ